MKNERDGYWSDLTAACGSAWNRFWFTPGDPLPCCVLRIAVGALVIAHLLTLGIGLERWYASDGLLPPSSVKTLVLVGTEDPYYHPSYFNLLGPSQSRIVHYAAIGVAAAFALGLLTRLSGVLTLVALLSYIHRVPMVAGHVDPLLVFLVAYLVVGPSGACFSLDRWLKSLRKKDGLPAADPNAPSMLANLSIRLIQVHLAAFVAMMGLAKLYGDAWWDGEGIWHLLAATHSRPLDLTFLRGWEYLINFWTHAIVYFELAFPVLIWNRMARPLLLGMGVVLWLSIVLATGLLLFGVGLIVASLAFVPAETLRGWVASGGRVPKTASAAA